MSFKVTRDVSGRPQIMLQGEPSYCKTLEAAPASQEPELDAGQWLVMAFAAWSMPEIEAINTALSVAKHFGGRLTLGLRPFDDPQEIGAWCPAAAGNGESPVWVLLQDDEVRFVHRGVVDIDVLVTAINRAMSGD